MVRADFLVVRRELKIMKFVAVMLSLCVIAGSSMACPGKAPLFSEDFTARSQVADRGRVYEWTYHASSRMHDTEYFGKSAAIEVTTVSPMASMRQLWFDIPSCRMVLAVDGSDAVTYQIIDSEYAAVLHEMVAVLRRMQELDGGNAKLARVVDYLQHLTD